MIGHPLPPQLLAGDTIADERTVDRTAVGPIQTMVTFTDGSIGVFDNSVPLARGALATHLLDAHHVATVPAPAEAEHLHGLLHDTRLIRLDHHHKGASL